VVQKLYEWYANLINHLQIHGCEVGATVGPKEISRPEPPSVLLWPRFNGELHHHLFAIPQR
jgi:hypothetical protein